MGTHPTIKPAKTNRLAREKSPYLLQHQYNPVDWFAWGPDAFARARQEGKPIFLSIGYSTCHWCHVMERESFEDQGVADFLNENFVSIKLDREERPDVDKIYMTFVQATTGHGGWPLNVFLTPDLKPIWGGTYFPPDHRQGRPSFLEVVRNLHGIWQRQRGEVVNSANEMSQRMAQHLAQPPPQGSSLTAEQLQRAAQLFKQEFDPRHGGFGSAPKFPRPAQPRFLLIHAAKTGDLQGINMVLRTCEQMAAGGIYDQLGGGFARYSVDAAWLVPHFEKMLYDNAQLVHQYLEAYLLSGEARHASVARGALDYVLRDMTHPEGGFYSAEDADSEGKEGKFYCWTQAELAALLPPEELAVVTRYFGITARGNFVDHSDPAPLANQNVLSIVHPSLTATEAAALESAKAKMLAARSLRVRPHRDDKILSSWNGLMLGAMARAGAVLGERRYLEAAERNLAFLRGALWDEERQMLFHRWREGERDTVQLLDAYAYLLEGVLELYQAGLSAATLDFAVALADSMIKRFYDHEAGGFWQSDPQTADLIMRIKEDYDGAEPSGNSVAVLALLKLAAITEREEYREPAVTTLRLLAKRMDELPQAVPYLLIGLDFYLTEPKRIALAPGSGDTGELLRAAHSVFSPNQVVHGVTGAVGADGRARQAAGGRPTAWVCTAAECLPPIQDPQALRRLLQPTNLAQG